MALRKKDGEDELGKKLAKMSKTRMNAKHEDKMASHVGGTNVVHRVGKKRSEPSTPQ